MSYELMIEGLGLAVVLAPSLLLIVLGVTSLVGHPLCERIIGRLVLASTVIGLVASIIMLGLMLWTGNREVPIDLGEWVKIQNPTWHYHFSIKFVFDRLSVPFVILSYMLCGTIGAFANKYMHRELGFNRFFVFYALFMTGMAVTALAGTIETLFAGWELVGLSSALLIAFYHERPAPPRNALHVWIVYRISDAALLMAALAMHHMTGEGDFAVLMGSGPWPQGHAMLTQQQALVIGFLLLLAAAGKSGLVPFSGWLPRAMEGPTPSSAVFYGALSVHLGAFLLLRISPILDDSPILCAAVVLAGLSTAVLASFTGRVQTDIKCALAFASLTQVGIIVAEIGFGLRYIALIHMLGHACLRTLQFLRAPSLLHDYRSMENAIGSRLPQTASPGGHLVPATFQLRLYRLAIERGFLDTCLLNYVVQPVLGAFRWFDSLERRWTDFLAGGPSRESELLMPKPEPLDDLV